MTSVRPNLVTLTAHCTTLTWFRPRSQARCCVAAHLLGLLKTHQMLLLSLICPLRQLHPLMLHRATASSLTPLQHLKQAQPALCRAYLLTVTTDRLPLLKRTCSRQTSPRHKPTTEPSSSTANTVIQHTSMLHTTDCAVLSASLEVLFNLPMRLRQCAHKRCLQEVRTQQQ